MNAAAAARPRSDWLAAAGVAAAGLATAVAAVVGDGDPLVVALPVVVATLGAVAVRVPLRYSALVFVVALLGLDDRDHGGRLWTSPFSPIGDFLRANLNATFRSGLPPGLGSLSGMEVLILAGVALGAARRFAGSRLDTAGREPAGTALRDVSVILLAALAVAVGLGLWRGGRPDVVIWHVRPWLDTLALLWAFLAAFRGSADHVAMGRAVVIAALLKVAFTIWIDAELGPLACTTNHGDSMLYVAAALVVLAHLAERTDGTRALNAALVLPILFWGMKLNNRRLAWVELIGALMLLWLVSGNRPWKRSLKVAALALVPLLLVYVAAGWDSKAPMFAPVATLRSVGDSTVDRSTLDRDVEIWNLSMSMAPNRLLGTGFGHEYVEYIVMDDISHVFKEYKTMPHNMVLGFFVFAGAIGVAGLWSLFVGTVFLAARAYRRATSPEDRAAALVAMGVVLVLLMQTYGDMGPASYQWKVLLALAATVAGKLAVATGAWPRPTGRPADSGLATGPAR